MISASRYGQHLVVDVLLSDTRIKVNIAKADTGDTALIWASSYDNVNVVKHILSHPKIKVNQGNVMGETALYWASARGSVNAVKELLSHPHINVNQARTEGQRETPLFAASYYGFVEVVKELLSHPHIDVNKGRNDKTSPLLGACWQGKVDVVKELLADARVDPNKLGATSQSNAIIFAAFYGRLEAAKILLRCPKVILGIGDARGKTELDWAREKGYPDIVKAIESRSTLLEMGHTC